MRWQPVSQGVLALVMVGLIGGAIAIRPASTAETSVASLAQKTHFHGIAVDSNDPRQVILATHHGLYIVTNGSARKVSETGDDFMGFTAHPTSPGVLYASGHPVGGGNLGFIVSNDGGRTWQSVGDGAHGPSDFHQMAISPVDPSTVYGVYGTDLQASRDGGRTWEVVSQVPDRIYDLAASTKMRSGLYAASQGGLLHSPDGGQLWEQLTDAQNPVTMVETTAGGQIYAFVVGEGLTQASESDMDWRTLGDGPDGSVILHFAAAPAESRTFYAVTFNMETRQQGLYGSYDDGQSWVSLGTE